MKLGVRNLYSIPKGGFMGEKKCVVLDKPVIEHQYF